MIRLKTHIKPINEHTEIDRYLLIPKKLWDDFETGELGVRINKKKIKTRIYDIFCECIGSKHTHRILDLREAWSDLGLKESQSVEIEKC